MIINILCAILTEMLLKGTDYWQNEIQLHK